ncbi:MAG: DNA gyrase subunit A [Candidatus Pacebacteria bacterium]|nr:DNA gyrase subunit A [Candidatus Paceibacterota bacterium]
MTNNNSAAVPPSSGADIAPVTIEDEMHRSYLDYAMSVIVSRALPDVRDGLKPVHRRILYAMKQSGLDWNKDFIKSANIVGEVIGKYHPHGDVAIYDAMVRMAQDFAMREILVKGQGNFGSLDGDPPAAYRYTEAKLSHLAEYLLTDLDKNTVDFQENYDGRHLEPTVLPAEFPNLLVNGSDGIAVGMATKIPPHNLGEVLAACCALIDNPALSDEELLALVPAPDFPNGGIIINPSEVRRAYLTGKGSIWVRSRTTIEEIRKDRMAIIVTETPFQVNKSRLMERIAELVNDKTIESISDLRDESDRDGTRMVIELKRDALPELVLKQLFRHSDLQISFGVNSLALRNRRPERLTLRQMLEAFIAFRHDVITRRSTFLLNKARERAHLLLGLAIAVSNIDEIIALIRRSTDSNSARAALMERGWPIGDVYPLLELIEDIDFIGDARVSDYYLSESQARGILDLRLHRLTGLERGKIDSELKDISLDITNLLEILGSKQRLYQLMRDELVAIQTAFANPRRTTIEPMEGDEDSHESMIRREAMTVTVSHNGYIKRTALSTYRAQRRGGKGRSGMATREEDFVEKLFVADTHTPVLFFSDYGRAYELKVWRLPEGTPQSRGKPMINLLPLELDERIATIMPLPEVVEQEGEEVVANTSFILFATSKGEVRRNALSDFLNIKANGKIAMKLEDEEGHSLGRLIAVSACEESQDVILATRQGQAIRFPVSDLRVFGSRSSTGVRGIRLRGEDELVSLSLVEGSLATSPAEREAYLKMAAQRRQLANDEGGEEAVETAMDESGEDSPEALTAVTLTEDRFLDLAQAEEFILTITAQGFGKRTSSYAYRTSGRGGQGIKNMEIASRGDEVVATFPVHEDDEIMLVTDGGQLIRTKVAQIRIAGRATQGVRVIRVAEGEKVVSVTRFEGVEEGVDSTTEEAEAPQ